MKLYFENEYMGTITLEDTMQPQYIDFKADECLYVGDGGSNELEAAEALGMKAVQAVWYLKEGTTQSTQRKEEFEHAETPLDIIDFTEE